MKERGTGNLFPEFDFEGKGVILGSTEKSERGGFPQLLSDAPQMKLQLALGANVLEELHDLLEEYAPTWYTASSRESRIRLTTDEQAVES